MISVIIPTRNGSNCIQDAIKSVQAQSEKDLEILVISDASTDDTNEKVTVLAGADPRIRLIALDQNVGPGRARTLAIKEARAEFIALLDDDDIWTSPEKLTHQKSYLETNPECVLVGSDRVQFVDENKNPLFIFESEKTDTDLRQHLLLHNPFVTSSVVFKKSAYEKAGGFSDLRLAEEYELWLKMAKLGTIANLKDSDVQYTQRASGLTLSRKQEMNRVVLELVRRHKNDYPHFKLALLKAHTRILLSWLGI